MYIVKTHNTYNMCDSLLKLLFIKYFTDKSMFPSILYFIIQAAILGLH